MRRQPWVCNSQCLKECVGQRIASLDSLVYGVFTAKLFDLRLSAYQVEGIGFVVALNLRVGA